MAAATLVVGVVVVLLIGVVIRRVLRGWRDETELEADLIGELPDVPDEFGPAVIAPAPGRYVGSAVAPDWLDRVTVDDLGLRCKAVLTRYPEGILLERLDAAPIWIPQRRILGLRTERGMPGETIPGHRGNDQAAAGILVIRWRLPSGTEIDTGFRADTADYARWTAGGNRTIGD